MITCTGSSVVGVVLERTLQIVHVVLEASVADDTGVPASDGLANAHEIATIISKRRYLANHLDAEQRFLTAGGPAGTRCNSYSYSTAGGLSLFPGRWWGHCTE